METEQQSRGAVEERSHGVLPPAITPRPAATFPSYDLCFPALPVKKGGGPTIQVGCPDMEVQREVRTALDEHLLRV